MDSWEDLAERIAREPGTARADAAHAALQILRPILRDDWLGGGWLPPELAVAFAHTVAFAHLLELALRLDQIRDSSGAAVLRNELRSNRTSERWRHIQLQLEVAALAVAVGAEVDFESGLRNGWPADVVVSAHGETIPVETFVLYTSVDWRAAVRETDAISDRILALEFRNRLSLVVDFGGATLEKEELERWLRKVEEAAGDVAAGGPRRTVACGDVRAEIAPADDGPPSEFNGPPISSNPWSRIVRKLDDKRRQATSGARGVWLRVDLLDGTWQFSEWGRSPLASKLDVLAASLRDEFANVDGLDGFVVSTGPMMAQGSFDDEDAATDGGAIALRRNLQPVRVRETLIVPLRPDAARAARVFSAAYSAEPVWLAEALRAAGLGTVEAVFDVPLAADDSSAP